MSELKLGAGAGQAPTRRTAHELVREQLRQAILRGTLEGGTRLVQAEIAAQLQVSTTPVREALRDLATEGLIQLDAHRGAIVRTLDFSEVSEIYDLRRLLEPEAMRRAARDLDEHALAAAEELQRQMDEEDDVGVWADLNRQFHGRLIDGIDSPRLKSALENLRDSAAPYVGFMLKKGQEHLADANKEHHALLKALRDRDGERAAAVTEQHLEGTVKALRQASERVENS